MELFKKKGKQPEEKTAERNCIEDRELKMNLANTAVGLLVPGEDFEQLENTRCEFGYLFWIEEHGLEALFKITTDKRECYVAAQKESLMRLNINEELFRSTAETFLSMHQ